jgi:hypothetical protein
MTADSGAARGNLIAAVAERLAARGFNVAVFVPDEYLLIGGVPGRYELRISDDVAEAELECRPAAGAGTDPRWLADVALALLGGHSGEDRRPVQGADRTDLALKARTGLAARARGLEAGLAVCEDTAYLSVNAEVAITNPGDEDAGEVLVSDTGRLTWQRDWWPKAAATGHEAGALADTGQVAAWIVDAVAPALALAGAAG